MMDNAELLDKILERIERTGQKRNMLHADIQAMREAVKHVFLTKES